MDTLYFDPYPIIPSPEQASHQIEQLDFQMRQLKEKMQELYFHENDPTALFSEDKKNYTNISNTTKHRLPSNSLCNEHSCEYKKELETLRRDYNKSLLTTAFIKKEISAYEKRVHDESKFRQKLQDELNRLAKALEESQKYCSMFKDENSNSVTLNINLLNEQLKTYKEDYFAEHKERTNLKTRNIELETQLEEAKETLELQQKKLLMYADFFTNPIRTQLSLHAQSSSSKPLKSSSVPSTPSYYKADKQRKTVIPNNASLMTKSYKSNEHIQEHTIHSQELDKKRKTSLTLPTHYDTYESFHWDSDTEYSPSTPRQLPSPTSRSYENIYLPPNHPSSNYSVRKRTSDRFL